jgi:CO/xanthine dehydrogenase FAD-binding subunit
MKKLFTFLVIATIVVACGEQKKQPLGLTVEKFFENPGEFVGQDTTIVGTILNVCDSTGKFALGTKENTELYVVVTSPADAKVCKGCVDKEVAVKGVIAEVVVNEEFIAALENESIAETCAEAKECKDKKVAEYKETFAAKGAFSLYSIEAASVKATEKKACCKDGEKEECKAEEENCNKDSLEIEETPAENDETVE